MHFPTIFFDLQCCPVRSPADAAGRDAEREIPLAKSRRSHVRAPVEAPFRCRHVCDWYAVTAGPHAALRKTYLRFWTSI